MTHPDPATQAQHEAADPDRSVWLSANAGSGKTKVLTDRVARHLLRGTAPERILCLTYTKAAANEMQNRLFKRLGDWAMLPDDDLGGALRALGVAADDISPDLVARARTLFARAVETPGGLKIQTIHSFCSGLLRRFPMEARVPPLFRELDEAATQALRRTVLADMARGTDRDVLVQIGQIVAESELDSLLAELVTHQQALSHPQAEARLTAELGLDPSDTHAQLMADIILPGDREMLERLATQMEAGSSTDQKNATTLRERLAGPQDGRFLQALEKMVLTGEGAAEPFSAKIPGFPTKATRARIGADEAALDALMRRIETARPRRLALELMARNRVLLTFARLFLRRITDLKETLGVLDFDDLILKARALLTDRGVAQWVLFRLDGGIDHVLVDEAQDTSPLQWDVIQLLTQEFTTGESATSEANRTIFVVGDPKQSIYSFQGADPDGFNRMARYFETELKKVRRPFAELSLRYSFRSSPGILDFVDGCFDVTGHYGLGQTSEHRAFYERIPGRVDLWPALPKPETPELPAWYEPRDVPGLDDPRLVLARHVATTIRQILSDGTQITTARDGTRPVRPSDFLILVQSRSPLFHEIIRRCKAEGIPIAGADRLEVGAELAVRDLMAFLSFLATPEDDLALACVLRSPLFGWTDGQLYALCQPRGSKFLWQALRDGAGDADPTLAILRDMLENADFLRPFELLERILTRHDGRAKLIARLGREAEDGIDALLSQALAFERENVPSLTAFLTWFLSFDLTIKRQIDTQRDEVRVMTVHGAKGLEAPIVILPDCGVVRDRTHQNKLMSLPGAGSGLRPSRPEAPPACRASIDDERQAAAQERMRLFYVAMTRAETWLIIAAAGETGKDLDSWHAIAEQAEPRGLEASEEMEFPTGRGRRLSYGTWPAPRATAQGFGATEVERLVLARPETPEPAVQTVSPSAMGGEKIVAGSHEGTDRDSAMDRGTLVHLLLETLPEHDPSEWQGLAETLLADPAPDATARRDILAEARRVLDAPELAEVFGPDSLAEVAITAPAVTLGAPILGKIDRLLVTPDRVVAFDFKTNAIVPDAPDETPDGLLRQMGAYQMALEQVYPDRAVSVALIWTRTASRMDLPAGLVRAAFAAVPPVSSSA